MKRLDLVFCLTLCLLALFVGHEALDARKHATALSHRTASFGATRVTDAPATGFGEVEKNSTSMKGSSDSLALTREVADVRRRLEVAAPGTYIGDVLASRDSSLARWPERRTVPLRIWVQPAARVKDFAPSFVPLVRQAFSDWGEVGIPIAFTFVFDSSSADVRVTWIDRFDETISGKTLWAHDENWWIVDAQIVLAVHHKSGEALDAAAMRAIALHEVGHLIGLDHTSDTTAIMTPRVRVKELSASDRATAQLLYLLPPGRIGATAQRPR
jgi:predicted Zn-dependent protease